jgi:hypothetical protein
VNRKIRGLAAALRPELAAVIGAERFLRKVRTIA